MLINKHSLNRTKALTSLAVDQTSTSNQQAKTVTFTDDDMLAPKPFHNRSLYVEAEMNGVAVKRVMVDPGSAVNLIPMSTVEALGIPKENIGGAPIEVYDLSSNCQLDSRDGQSQLQRWTFRRVR